MEQTNGDQKAITMGVLRGLAEGLTDPEVARQLHISTRTVQRVVDQFKQETGSPTRFAAGVAATQLGLV